MSRKNYKLMLFLLCVFFSSCKQIYVFKQEDYKVDKYQYNEIKELAIQFAISQNLLKNDTINILKDDDFFHRNYYVVKDTMIYSVAKTDNNFIFEKYTDKGIMKDIVTNNFIIPAAYLIDTDGCAECSSVFNYLVRIKNNKRIVILKGKVLSRNYVIIGNVKSR